MTAVKRKLTEREKKELDKFDEKFGIRHWDKLGIPMRMSDFIEKFEDIEYRRIDEYKGAFFTVSTVWLGMDHGHGDNESPVIFESMVFCFGEGIECWRYRTMEKAKEGHAKLVKLFAWRVDIFLVQFIRSLGNIFYRD